jgi:hypothetical protein
MRVSLVYVAGGLAVVWGTAHLIATRSVVDGFGDISRDNRLYITQEWIAEGVAICFAGVLVLLVTALAGPDGRAAQVVYATTAGFFLIIAVLTALTGSRTPVMPFKICPFLLTFVALLLLLGAFL